MSRLKQIMAFLITALVCATFTIFGKVFTLAGSPTHDVPLKNSLLKHKVELPKKKVIGSTILNDSMFPVWLRSNNSQNIQLVGKAQPAARRPRAIGSLFKSAEEEFRVVDDDGAPRNISRTESPHYPWGSHAFGPLKAYQHAPEGMDFVAYFYDQTIAVVLEDDQRLLRNCTLLEVIPTHEQRSALRRLGVVMALVPLNLQQMLLLARHCFSPEERTALPQTRNIKDDKPMDFSTVVSSAVSGILPGTTWCGLGDRATYYHTLGERPEVDACCREHDHCPVKLRASARRYGVLNTGFSTVSHCMCDKMFLHCLEKAAKYDHVAKMVGKLFFNILAPKCLTLEDDIDASDSKRRLQTPRTDVGSGGDYSPRLTCSVKSADGTCRRWVANPKALELKLVIVQPNLHFSLSKP